MKAISAEDYGLSRGDRVLVEVDGKRTPGTVIELQVDPGGARATVSVDDEQTTAVRRLEEIEALGYRDAFWPDGLGLRRLRNQFHPWLLID